MIAAIISPISIPSPVVVEAHRYYEIKGRHEAELVREMNLKGYHLGKSTYWGYTSPIVQWTFDVKKNKEQQCILVNPRVAVLITTTLPSWKSPAGTSDSVIAKWNKLYAALKHHEGEHGQIAKDEGDALAALMRSHPSDHTCKQLKSYLHVEAHEIFKTDRERNAELDQRTHHGVDEGVAISW